MKYMIRVLSLIVVVFIVTGCSCNKPVVKVVTKYKYFNLDKDILRDDVNISIPPKKQIYIDANPIEREALLRDYVLSLYGNINSYKIKLHKLNEQDEKIKKEIEILDTK